MSPGPERSTRHEARAVCAPGLEGLVAAELSSLGLRPAAAGRGGVPFRPTTRQLYLANVALRCATRVVVRAGSFRATTFPELMSGAQGIPWERWLIEGQPVRFRVASHGSRLFHTGAIEQRLREVLGAPDGDQAQLVVVRVNRDRVTVGIDTSGEALHRRGWRLDGAKAPIRETLGAASLLAVGWDGSVPLIDPFCGSGTIAVEAALIARRIAPGRDRPFAFSAWPSFEPGTWASVSAEIAGLARPDHPVSVVAADRDAGAVQATRANAARAGVADAVEVREATISDLVAPTGPLGWMVTNPPWGGRLRAGQSEDLRNLYARLGAIVREQVPRWGVALLVADPALAGQTKLGSLREQWRTTSGGTPVRLLARPPRPPKPSGAEG